MAEAAEATPIDPGNPERKVDYEVLLIKENGEVRAVECLADRVPEDLDAFPGPVVEGRFGTDFYLVESPGVSNRLSITVTNSGALQLSLAIIEDGQTSHSMIAIYNSATWANVRRAVGPPATEAREAA